MFILFKRVFHTKHQKTKKKINMFSEQKPVNRGYFCNLLGYSLLWKIFFVISIATVASTVLGCKSYYRYYVMARESHVKYQAIDSQCVKDPNWVALAQQEEECREAKRNKDIWPSLIAFFDLMEDFQLCGRYGCLQIIDGFASSFMFKILILVVILWYLGLAAFGFGLTQESWKRNNAKWELPSFFGGRNTKDSNFGNVSSGKIKDVEKED